MDITFYKIENNTITQVNQDIKPESWNEKVDWIDCRTDDRNEVINYFQKQNFDSNVIDYIGTLKHILSPIHLKIQLF